MAEGTMAEVDDERHNLPTACAAHKFRQAEITRPQLPHVPKIRTTRIHPLRGMRMGAAPSCAKRQGKLRESLRKQPCK
eukprot:6310360-Amphidinium_carterae.1